MALLKPGRLGSSCIFPPWLTIRYKRPSAWCQVWPSPLRGGAGSVPSSLGICQSGWPWAAAPWQAAQVAVKISLPVREAGSVETTPPDVGPFSPVEDEQAITKTGASSSTVKAVARSPVPTVTCPRSFDLPLEDRPTISRNGPGLCGGRGQACPLP